MFYYSSSSTTTMQCSAMCHYTVYLCFCIYGCWSVCACVVYLPLASCSSSFSSTSLFSASYFVSNHIQLGYQSFSLSLSLFLFLLSSLLINKLDYWFRKPTGKRIDRDTGRKTEWRQRDRETESVRLQRRWHSLVDSACINPPPNVRLTRRSDCVPTATWKTTSVVWHIIWSTYHLLYLHQRDTINTKGDRRLGIIPRYSGRRFFESTIPRV